MNLKILHFHALKKTEMYSIVWQNFSTPSLRTKFWTKSAGKEKPQNKKGGNMILLSLKTQYDLLITK